jgi:DNA-binding LacI/PurR family transcriptional regulator
MKATLKDISEKTGLSISTVSRILRGESKTSSENVELTIRTAQEINYPINSRVLNGRYNYKKRLQIALITSFEPDEFYSTFYHGFNSATKDENINLALYAFNPDENSLSEFVRELSYNSIDAAILFLPTLQEKHYLEILEKCPDDFTLLSVAPLFNPVLDTITFDSYRGGYIVAQHFYERGYRQLGVITGPSNKNESLLRKNGFTDFINQKPDMKLIWQYEGDYSFQAGKSSFEEYSSLSTKPQAIFASNDYMCLGFLEQATKMGVSIPDQVAIAGYDDLPICGFVHPSITSVHTNYETLGKKAFQLLKEKMESSSSHSGILSIIPVSLSVRHTT